MGTHLHPRLRQIDLHGDLLPCVDVGVVGLLKGEKCKCEHMRDYSEKRKNVLGCLSVFKSSCIWTPNSQSLSSLVYVRRLVEATQRFIG